MAPDIQSKGSKFIRTGVVLVQRYCTPLIQLITRHVISSIILKLVYTSYVLVCKWHVIYMQLLIRVSKEKTNFQDVMSTTTVFSSLMTGLSAVCVLLLIASCLSMPSLEFIGIQQPLKKFLNRYILTDIPCIQC